MVNERSLANLKLPKPRKEGHGYRYSLPQEKIDELFTYLAEGKSIKAAAKEAKMAFETARKYFREGDANRGIKPLQFRLTIFQDRISEKFNILLEERRGKMLDITKMAVDSLEEGLKDSVCKCCDGESIQVDKQGIKSPCLSCYGRGKIPGHLLNKSNLNHLDKLIRLEVFLSGGLTTKVREKKLMTAEELSG